MLFALLKNLMFLLMQSIYAIEKLVSELVCYYVRNSNIYVGVMLFYHRVCFLPFFQILLTSLKQIQNSILRLMKYQGRYSIETCLMYRLTAAFQVPSNRFCLSFDRFTLNRDQQSCLLLGKGESIYFKHLSSNLSKLS